MTGSREWTGDRPEGQAGRPPGTWEERSRFLVVLRLFGGFGALGAGEGEGDGGGGALEVVVR
ncbi:hypothetical protein, partial [Arthrobacter sp. M2012083]|uniref:hypothetical protein n=1 Tax=Arthrobacter sp. M2012083 TaxID=1197706 RepID=UPI001ED910DB